MHQNALITTLRSLYPEIQKRAAAPVLTEYAENHGLSPDQLRRLGQNYNTHRQLRQLKEAGVSGDRGQTVPLLDVEAMVERFVGEPQTKAAAAVRVCDPLVDLTDRTERLNQLVKAAATTESPEPEVKDERHDPDQLVDEALRQAGTARFQQHQTANDLIDRLRHNGSVDMTRTEKLARQQRPVDQAAVFLVKVAASRKLDVRRYDGPPVKQAMPVRTDESDMLVRLADLMDEQRTLEKVACDPSITGLVKAADANTQQGPADLLSQFESASQSDPAKDTRPDHWAEGDPEPPGESGGGQTPPAREASEPSTDQSEKKETKTEDKSDTDKHRRFRAADLLKVVTVPAGAAAKGVVSAKENVGRAMDEALKTERRNTGQESLDRDIRDIRRAVGIRRLAGTDPVLRELPMKSVLDAYNAIAETDPEIADSPDRLKLALREAVAYEGLTLDAQKLLTDIRKGQTESVGKEGELQDRRYATKARKTPSKPNA